MQSSSHFKMFLFPDQKYLLFLPCFADFLSCCVTEFYLIQYFNVLPFIFNSKFAARENNHTIQLF